MAPQSEFLEYVVEQMQGSGEITHRQMFGGCTVYCDGKVVALICDNNLFVKQTEKGKAYMGEFTEAPPYPGAKSYLLIEDQMEDTGWLRKLISITADELPLPKKRKPRKPKKS